MDENQLLRAGILISGSQCRQAGECVLTVHLQSKKTSQSKLAHRKTSTSQTRCRTMQSDVVKTCCLLVLLNSLETYVLTYAYRHQTPAAAGQARNLLFPFRTWTRIHQPASCQMLSFRNDSSTEFLLFRTAGSTQLCTGGGFLNRGTQFDTLNP